MERHGTISAFDAFRHLRITSLAQRIYDLKKDGKKIGRFMVSKQNADGNAINYCRYYLVKQHEPKEEL